MDSLLTKDEIRKINKHFGNEFSYKVQKYLEMYSDEWKLKNFELVDYFSVHCLCFCQSQKYGNAVLKICNTTRKEFLSECNALIEYKNRRFCRLFDYNLENEVMLIERLSPGNQLKEEDNLGKRLSVFSSLFNGLHKQSDEIEKYDTYVGWVCRITEFMETQQGYDDLAKYMKRARDICTELSSEYNRKMLLHGDFHYDNILLNDDQYKIIDPKGVIGDPVFDVPRYTLNEYCDAAEVSYEVRVRFITEVFAYFKKNLGIPTDIQKKCLFIEMAMSACWSVESGFKPDIDSVRFADYLMNNKTEA